MLRPIEPHQRARFGDFELDLQTAELCTNGHRVTLQGQPFQILAVLLERPGRLVTRDELRDQLWPSNTFVGFDHSLNKAVNRLRVALEDSAEQPRFIQTLPRRGYRWIAPLEWVEGCPISPSDAPKFSPSQPVVSKADKGADGEEQPLARRTFRESAIQAAVFIVLLVAGIAVWLTKRQSQTTPLPISLFGN
jgi:DNA-binding winged helix-turn-helix (wHTH) protein